MAKGKFITVEGVEGVGKSTNISTIQTTLLAHAVPFILTREPGGSPLSEKVRLLLLDRKDTDMTPMAELLLVLAARVQHVDTVIRPALARGDWVVCDRFSDSTYAYQGGGRGIDPSVIQRLETETLRAFRPDLTILLDLPPQQGLARARERGDVDRFEAEDATFFDRVRRAFLDRAAAEEDRFRIVDASADLESVNRAVRQIVEALMSAPGSR